MSQYNVSNGGQGPAPPDGANGVTQGAITRIFSGEQLNSPVLQVLSIKRGTDNQQSRVMLGDAERYTEVMLSPLEVQQLYPNALVMLTAFYCEVIKKRKTIVVLEMEVVDAGAAMNDDDPEAKLERSRSASELAEQLGNAAPEPKPQKPAQYTRKVSSGPDGMQNFPSMVPGSSRPAPLLSTKRRTGSAMYGPATPLKPMVYRSRSHDAEDLSGPGGEAGGFMQSVIQQRGGGGGGSGGGGPGAEAWDPLPPMHAGGGGGGGGSEPAPPPPPEDDEPPLPTPPNAHQEHAAPPQPAHGVVARSSVQRAVVKPLDDDGGPPELQRKKSKSSWFKRRASHSKVGEHRRSHGHGHGHDPDAPPENGHPIKPKLRKSKSQILKSKITRIFK